MKRYIPAAAVIAWLAVLYCGYSTNWPRPYDDVKNALFYLGAALAVLPFFCARRPLPLRVTIPLCLALLYCLLVLFSFFPSTTTYESALALARLLLWGGVAFAFSRLPQQQLRPVLLASTVLAAGIAWTQLVGWQGWKLFKYGMHPVGHISYYGDFVALQIPMVVYLIIIVRRWWWRVLLAPLLLLLFAGLWISGARASILALGFAGVVVTGYLLALGRLRWRLLMWVAAAVALVVAADHYQPGTTDFRSETTLARLQSVLTTDLDAISAGRMRGYRTTLRMIADRPWLGWGLGTFRFVYPEYAHDFGADALAMNNTWYMHPHNELLHQAMELGLPALLLWIGAIAALFWKTGAVLHTRPREQAPEIWLGIAGVTVCLVSWQFSTNFLFPVSRFLAALYAGVLWRELAPTFAVCGTIRIPRWAAVLPLVLATGLVAGESASLYAVQQIRIDPAQQVLWARRAWWLAPGAFNSTFAHAVMAAREADGPAGSLIDALHRHFPYVPIVLFYKAQRELAAGNIPAAREHLQHVLANDPAFTAARYMLEGME